jgi:O-methyltransferase
MGTPGARRRAFVAPAHHGRAWSVRAVHIATITPHALPPSTAATLRHFFSLKGRIARRWLARRGATLLHVAGGRGREDLALIRETHALVPLLMQDVSALHLLACVRACAARGGAMAEAGVFAGGTARLICSAKGDAPLHLFDVFESLQAASSAQAFTPRGDDLRRHFGAVHATRAGVERLLAGSDGVHVHQGIFPATTAGLDDVRFSFVHLDLDLEASTRDALEFFHPRLVPGGIILGDDHQTPPVRRAFDAYFRERADTVIDLPWGQVMAIKGGSGDRG